MDDDNGDNVVAMPSRPGGGASGGGHGGVESRLRELERRVDKVEGLAQKINDHCIEIKTQIGFFKWLLGVLIALLAIGVSVYLNVSG